MLPIIANVVYTAIILSLASSVYYSVKFRRQTVTGLRGLFQARQNISMGLTLVLIAANLLFLMPGTNTSMVIGMIFLLIGLFNLFAGLRNHAVYHIRKR